MMKYLKLSLLFFIALCEVAVAAKPDSAISTTLALKKYETLLKRKSFVVFPELREKPLRWVYSIPEEKIENANFLKEFAMTAQPGEFYVYQLGVWALNDDLKNIDIEFSDLKMKGRNGQVIKADRMTCFNKGGTDFMGKSFTKEVDVSSGQVQALWLGVDLDGIGSGTYSGSVTIKANGKKQTIPLLLRVEGEKVSNHGYNEGYRLARLNWLNSTVGENEEITKGYQQINIEGNVISILGRQLLIGENGLPESIVSFFDSNNQSIVGKAEPISRQALRFIIEKEDGELIKLEPGKMLITEQTPSKVVWKVLNTSDWCDLECTGQMEFDGFVDYKLKLSAKVPFKVKDIRLEIPITKEKSEYMMGLGREGGFRTPDWKWKWDKTKNQDMLWLGAVNGGMRVKWKAENYTRPLVNIYYEFGSLNMPPSWSNGGKGGVDVFEKDDEVIVNSYSGNRELLAGDQLNYDFEMLITPFRTIDKQHKFGDRYYHGGGSNTSVKVENALKAGANIINIHHAEDIYPFINYPYLDDNVKELTDLVAGAHEKNLRMKFYYTTRELTKNLPEFWALNSLNGEVIFPGPGKASRTQALHPNGPNKWLVENMAERKYIPAWSSLVKEGKFKGETDLSVITTPDSRLNNFYIAGLDWMVQNIGIDGVYIDDSALDRFTLRRARKVIDQHRPEGRMDLHSWNHFHKWAGYASCLNLYMDLLPYFDLVWIGESRDYNRSPDHWLVEVSGIPFGLAGQMLEGGGNPWRGMVYGITTRAGWTRNPPGELWKFWDKYNVEKKSMIGYWDKNSPVTISSPSIKASVYQGSDEVIISVASWAGQDEEVSVTVNWAKLGLDSTKFDVLIPGIKDFQIEQKQISLDKIIVPKGKGYLIVLKQKGKKLI